MDIQSSTGVATLQSALQQQATGAAIIDKTLSKVSAAGGGGAATGGIDADAQKAVLSAAYADQGKGTQVDVVA